MKEIIVDILEGILALFVIAATIVGFVVLGNAGPFGNFSFGRALLGGVGGFLFAILSSGVVYVLLVIRDQQDEQIRLLRQIENGILGSERAMKRSRLASVEPVVDPSRPTPGPSSVPPPGQPSLRRCRSCNTILNDGASECHRCGVPAAA